ncbi:hypothetical protein AAFF_G00268410 [Aldrovandia affinis]|uniref:Uncharacterized protein n=1 Tax=Aldrovandia affinis TaxID=143900 RepID=A0AAD7STB9_9TELE|nr:hypothetical protein AAFF_G00268410 [Aldrovandia affinis]
MYVRTCGRNPRPSFAPRGCQASSVTTSTSRPSDGGMQGALRLLTNRASRQRLLPAPRWERRRGYPRHPSDRQTRGFCLCSEQRLRGGVKEDPSCCSSHWSSTEAHRLTPSRD